MARLDRLAPVKEVAQIGAASAASSATSCWPRWRRWTRPRCATALDQLVAAELVFRRGTPPEATYSFKHALVQDAAYQQPAQEQAPAAPRPHRRGAWRSASRSRRRAQPELLAHHCTEAGLAARGGRLLAQGRAAGDRALGDGRGGRPADAGAGAAAGLPAGPERDAQGARSADRPGRRCSMRRQRPRGAGGGRGLRAGPRAVPTGRLAPQLLAALSGLFVHHLHGPACTWRWLGIARGAAALGRAAAGHAAQAMAHRCFGASSLFKGELAAAAEHFERALALYDPAAARPCSCGPPTTRVSCLNFMRCALCCGRAIRTRRLARGQSLAACRCAAATQASRRATPST